MKNGSFVRTSLIKSFRQVFRCVRVKMARGWRPFRWINHVVFVDESFEWPFSPQQHFPPVIIHFLLISNARSCHCPLYYWTIIFSIHIFLFWFSNAVRYITRNGSERPEWLMSKMDNSSVICSARKSIIEMIWGGFWWSWLSNRGWFDSHRRTVETEAIHFLLQRVSLLQ